MGSNSIAPPPPPGFKLVSQPPQVANGTAPPPPPGFRVVGDLPMTPPPIGKLENVPSGMGSWLESLESDIRHGGTATFPGRVLHALGAQGTEVGSQGAASTPLQQTAVGPVHMAQGAIEAPRHPLDAALKIGQGAMETSSIPAAFAAPEVSETAINAIPNKAWAGKMFQSVMQDAGGVPVQLSRTTGEMTRLKELVDAAGQMPRGMSKMFRRIADIDADNPLTYREARDFYSNVSKLTGEDAIRLTKPVKAQMVKVAQAFKADIGDAAGEVGRAADYYAAMKDYARASKLQDQAIKMGKYMLAGAASTAGASAAYEAYKALK